MTGSCTHIRDCGDARIKDPNGSTCDDRLNQKRKDSVSEQSSVRDELVPEHKVVAASAMWDVSDT